ncbi:hypothetical protein [Halomicrococcus sp. NG-SE-24]|uniref:hypothetical protein n=1 Tax=Halomicrococcus sp. NG-SE-24 TaxID=3436928 RepID=UPI003D963A77
MNPEKLPFVGAVFRFGARDRVLDTILLLGPVVILAFVILGRNLLTKTVTGLYILSFIGYVLYNGIR